MKNVLTIVGIVLVAGSFVYGLALVGNNALTQSEIVACKKWSSESAQYTGYYILQWQKDQCESHNIIINAPIK